MAHYKIKPQSSLRRRKETQRKVLKFYSFLSGLCASFEFFAVN